MGRGADPLCGCDAVLVYRRKCHILDVRPQFRFNGGLFELRVASYNAWVSVHS